MELCGGRWNKYASYINMVQFDGGEVMCVAMCVEWHAQWEELWDPNLVRQLTIKRFEMLPRVELHY